MPTTDSLPYESRTPGALGADETVLWEGGPLPRRRPPSAAAVFAVSSVALVVLLPGGALLATMDLLPPAFLCVVLIAAAGAIAYWALRGRREAEVTFRVTDRRVVRAPRYGAAAEVGLSNLAGFRFEHRAGAATCRFDDGDQEGNAVAFERLGDPTDVHGLLATLPDRVGRRATLRRTGASKAWSSATIQPAVPALQPPANDPPRMGAELPLGTGEVILWSGRPRARDPVDATLVLDRLKIAAWMLVPVAALLAHAGIFGFRFGHWAITGPAVIWIVMALHALTLAPWLAARRRGRTRYYLTNMRAVEDVVGRTRLTRSAFLDMVSETTVTVRDGSVGDVHLLGGSFNLERVADVWKLHGLLMEAVRGGGGSRPPDAGNA